MPTPVNFPDAFKKMYREVKEQGRRERRRESFWEKLVYGIIVSLILFAGTVLWVMTP